MKKKEEQVQNVNASQEPEVLEASPALEKANELNEEMLKLEEEIHTLTDQNKTLDDKLKTAQAELINYRKRKDEETENILKYSNQSIITEILPIIDTFERAFKGEESLSEEVKKYVEGFKMMYNNLLSVLQRYGVEEINRVGQIFDPKLEQALLTETREDLEDEVVIEVLQKGYKLKDRVIRPASVKVNQK